jgi:hypothetical protein
MAQPRRLTNEIYRARHAPRAAAPIPADDYLFEAGDLVQAGGGAVAPGAQSSGTGKWISVGAGGVVFALLAFYLLSPAALDEAATPEAKEEHEKKKSRALMAAVAAALAGGAAGYFAYTKMTKK